MENILGSLVVPVLILLLFTDDHWGPGVRNILNSVAHRIRYGNDSAQVSNAEGKDEGSKDKGSRVWGWLRWALTVAVGVPAAIYFVLRIYEDLS